MNIMIKTIEQLHNCLLETLSDFDKLCKDNNITYYIIWGTLIGAARHSDLIPWDDDVDVALDRENYDKLLRIRNLPNGYMLVKPGDGGVFYDFMAHFVNTKYESKRLDYKKDGIVPDYFFNPYLDVYVLEPSYSGIRNKIQFSKLMWLYAMARAHRPFDKTITYNEKHSILLEIAAKVAIGIGKKRKLSTIVSKYDSLSRKGHNNKGFLHASNADPATVLMQLKTEWFSESTTLPIRGKDYPVPSGYDALLRSIYGDYLQYPPETSRKPYHYDVEYSEYE